MKQSFLLTLLFLALPAVPALAAAPKIECTAQVYEVLADGSTREEKIPLTVETESATNITLSADLDGSGFTLSGAKDAGPYFVSITEEPDYTKGSLTTAEFSKEGRLQISVVNKTLVHKLECYKK